LRKVCRTLTVTTSYNIDAYSAPELNWCGSSAGAEIQLAYSEEVTRTEHRGFDPETLPNFAGS
jgi:hypothetical protein